MEHKSKLHLTVTSRVEARLQTLWTEGWEPALLSPEDCKLGDKLAQLPWLSTHCLHSFQNEM